MTRDEFTAGYLARQQAIESSEFDDAKHESATLDLADFLFDAFGTATGIATPREVPISTERLHLIANASSDTMGEPDNRELIRAAADELDALRSRVKDLGSRRGSLNAIQGINGIQR